MVTVEQPRPCPTSVAADLSVFNKLGYIELNPLLELRFEDSYFLSFPYILRKTIPLSCSPVAVAVLGQ